jgi:hypothetical protein
MESLGSLAILLLNILGGQVPVQRCRKQTDVFDNVSPESGESTQIERTGCKSHKVVNRSNLRSLWSEVPNLCRPFRRISNLVVAGPSPHRPSSPKFYTRTWAGGMGL